MTRTCRLPMSRLTGVPASRAPRPMWSSRLLWRIVTLPTESVFAKGCPSHRPESTHQRLRLTAAVAHIERRQGAHKDERPDVVGHGRRDLGQGLAVGIRPDGADLGGEHVAI